MGAYRISRERMVREHLVNKGITDPLVLKAMQTVPRHLFMPEAFTPQAYADCPVPIGFGQTISHPFVVANMSQQLKAERGMRVLEIGTGSGYQAAILFEMGLEVYTVERINELYTRSSNLFLQLRYRGIRCRLDDGTQGWAEAAPFDRIIVTAGGPSVPQPLIDQLADPGILVIPVGIEKRAQHLVSVKKLDGVITEEYEEQPVAFVDLVGQHGW